ncbi:MAG: DNA polymerase III subunit delta [Lachnospiraceae bacterium]|nr:DNA polymerase III subunit delta [Lachnospiraceae bacterium]
MKVITNDIQNRQFKPVYLLSGEETYLTRQFCERLAAAIAGEDTINVNRFQEKNPDIKEIISLADTMPFFAESRLIVIENSGFFKRDSSELAAYLSQMPESTHIIFREDEIDKRNKLFKKVKELGYFAEMKRQTESELERWILSILKKEGINLTRHTMSYLLETIGTDMNVIRNELDKLISYLGDKNVLEPADIDAICSRQISGQIFEMIDAMACQNRQKAFRLYYDLIALKEPPLRILFLITRQYLQLYQIKEMQQKGLSGSSLAAAAGLSSYAVKKVASRASRFSSLQLKHCIEECALMDEQIKTGQIRDSIAVELLITAFSA